VSQDGFGMSVGVDKSTVFDLDAVWICGVNRNFKSNKTTFILFEVRIGTGWLDGERTFSTILVGHGSC